MKSNEEFIAGIYEKAASYTEEKETKVIKVNQAAKATRIAAMVTVCIGLAGIGSLVLGNEDSAVPGKVPMPAQEEYGIALTSELGDEMAIGQDEMPGGAAQLRIMPVAETVTFTGVVERLDVVENRIWLKLLFDESAPEYAEGSIVCIRWDMLEPISEEFMVGTTLTATGALSRYENEASEQNGCAELVLTDKANLEIK